MKTLRNNKKLTILVACIVAFTSYSFKSDFFEIAKQIEIYTSLFKELNMYYVEEINPAEFTNKAIKNTLKDLDPYTNYYNEQDVEEAKISREGEYAGIGVSVRYSDIGIILTEIYQGYAADKNGLKVGDIITKVDGQQLKGLSREQLSEFLKGAPGTSVKLEVDRLGENFNFSVIREKVVYNPVPFYGMIDDVTGYIALSRFNLKASSEFRKAYEELEEKGMKQLVFDLRGNLGGSLREAIIVSNFFLPKNVPIVSTKGKVKKFNTTYRGTNDPLTLEMPMAVLIDRKSASASEIVSGALQDYDRAVILGERSFGKGLVQRYRELEYGTQLKLTISKYYTPSGRCIQELDYANRNKNGDVPKFSDGSVNTFKTKNGRVVYDGGGITPDIKSHFKPITVATESLLQSSAIFDFGTVFYHQNKNIITAKDFEFTNKGFRDFEKFLISRDTSFKTEQEKLFSKAFASVVDLQKEENLILKKLKESKIEGIKKNEERIISLIQDEIISRYYYEEGVYQNRLHKDKLIEKAVNVLNNKDKYHKTLARE